MSTLELRDIGVTILNKPIVSGVSLRLKPGEIAVLMGPNGAGKSTLMNAIMGLMPVSRGSVVLNGSDITGLSTRRRLSMGMSYLMQGGRVFDSLTVAENLEISAEILPASRRKPIVNEIYDLLPELRACLASRSGLLSSGIRQLLSVAMAILPNPRMLLMDEPCASLSPPLALQVLGLVLSLAEEKGISALIIEHRLESLKVAHSAFLLEDGMIQKATTNPLEWLTGTQIQ